jgi:hypothetical protein
VTDVRGGARISVARLKEVLDASALDEPANGTIDDALANHLNRASLQIDVIEAQADVSDETLEYLELYWAAEVATSQFPQAVSESMMSASKDYDVRTTYGELAVDMDPTGTLGGAGGDGGGAAVFDVPEVK